MDLLEMKFQELRKRGEGAHIAHVYYGDPCEKFSIRLIETLVENGADIIEFGIPFSDPIADGPIFQAACERALKAGITPAKCIKALKKLRDRGLEAPVIVTTYFNIPYIMGFERFLEKISAHAQGLLIPDLPLEEASPYIKMVSKKGLHLILQVAPTTSKERLKKIAEAATGFIYLISLEGVTGSRLKSINKTRRLIAKVKAHTNLPVIVGFGISRREHAEVFMEAGADGVVVGSAYTKLYAQKLENPFEKLPEIAKLASEIKQGCLRNLKKRSNNYLVMHK